MNRPWSLEHTSYGLSDGGKLVHNVIYIYILLHNMYIYITCTTSGISKINIESYFELQLDVISAITLLYPCIGLLLSKCLNLNKCMKAVIYIYYILHEFCCLTCMFVPDSSELALVYVAYQHVVKYVISCLVDRCKVRLGGLIKLHHVGFIKNITTLERLYIYIYYTNFLYFDF